jgi:hypothetical protein
MKASGFDGMEKAPLRSILHAKTRFAKRLFELGRLESFELRDKRFAFGVAKGGAASVAGIAKAARVGDTASIPWRTAETLRFPRAFAPRFMRA